MTARAHAAAQGGDPRAGAAGKEEHPQGTTPAELRSLERWVAWKPVLRRGKWTKAPIQPNGADASTTDPATWHPFAAVAHCQRRGFVVTSTPYLFIDLDGAFDQDTGEMASWANAIISRFPNAYIEWSPSHTGLHIFTVGEMPGGRGRKVHVPDAPAVGDHLAAVEAYSTGRYATMTGDAYQPVDLIGSDPDGLAWVLETYFAASRKTTTREPRPAATLDDQFIIQRASAAKNGVKFSRLWKGDTTGYGSPSEADMAFCGLLDFWTADPEQKARLLRASGLYREKHDRDDYVRRTVEESTGNGPRFGDGMIRADVLPTGDDVSLDDFRAYLPTHQYIFIPTRDLWPAASVNSRLGPVISGGETTPAAAWLDRHRPVEQMTWAPGEDLIIPNRLINHGGWIRRDGVATFNLYRPPAITHGDPRQADPWIQHVHRVYPAEADHIIAWLAHRVQRPNEKVNHAIVLGGEQGIGKDTILEPVKHAVGPWNFEEVSPAHLMGRFNGFVKSVVLRVSEARDLGDVDRYTFYDHMKVYTAAPPDVLRVDEKHLREVAVLNVCGVIITSNHKTTGIFLPPDDRRHFVAWSELTIADFAQQYWQRLWEWYAAGGHQHVAAYLGSLDISGFDAKAPPPKTDAFWDIVNANRAPEDDELTECMENLNWPDAVTIPHVIREAERDPDSGFHLFLKDRKNSRLIPHRFESVGYIQVRNETQTDGRWKVAGKNVVIYARKDLPVRDRIAAARKVATT